MTLIKTLLKETESLKLQYIEKTKVWAEKEYQRAVEMSKWNDEQWCKYLGVEPRVANEGWKSEFITFPRGFYNTSQSKEYYRRRNESQAIAKITLEQYLEVTEKTAERHYNNSIEKLAARIEKKELDQSKLKATTSHIGVNIDTVLTDGEKTVRAYTIIAEGPVQRPHYRYLIK